jgi:tRNA (adenine22-N1)-methyltransferase
MKLSHRLNTIYQHILPNVPLWDVCCDHGQLGFFAYQRQYCSHVFFVDQVETIMTNLERLFERKIRFENNPVQAHFFTRDGSKLDDNLTGTVVIAGIGGLNMKSMLLSWQSKNILWASRLILSPHRDEYLYQKADFLTNYVLTQEKIILENGHLRYIFIFDLKN